MWMDAMLLLITILHLYEGWLDCQIKMVGCWKNDESILHI